MQHRAELTDDQQIAISTLDSLIKTLNDYIATNKVDKNGSGRRENVKAIAAFIYNCFDININDKIDEVLTRNNRKKNLPEKLPYSQSLDIKITGEIFLKKFANTLSQIHTYVNNIQTGWRYRSTLQSSIDKLVKQYILLLSTTRNYELLDIQTKSNLMNVSTFFANTAPTDTYIYFTLKQANREHDYSPLLERLIIYLKFIKAKQTVQAGLETYTVHMGSSKKILDDSLAMSEFYLGLRLPFSIEQIKNLQQTDKVSLLGQAIKAIKIWKAGEHKPGEPESLGVQYDKSSHKFNILEKPALKS